MIADAGREERRGELRVPVEFPGVFLQSDAFGAMEGVLEDVSRSGARVKVPDGQWIDTGAQVTVDVTHREERYRASGTVRWCRKEEAACFVGLRFDAPLGLKLPVEDVASICSRLAGEPRPPEPDAQEATPLLVRTLAEEHNRAYWGGLFWILADAAHASYSCAAGTLSLNLFRLERFLAAMAPAQANEKAWTGARQALQELGAPEEKLKKTAVLFRLLKERQISAPETPNGTVPVDAILSGTVDEFVHAVKALADMPPVDVRFHRQPVRPLRGRARDFRQCFETLLLFTYQAALFGKAHVIEVDIRETDNAVEIRFGHNGMPILDAPAIEISPLRAAFLNRLAPREMKNGLWLHRSLLPVKDHCPVLVVSSEAGRNRIAVRFPLPTAP